MGTTLVSRTRFEVIMHDGTKPRLKFNMNDVRTCNPSIGGDRGGRHDPVLIVPLWKLLYLAFAHHNEPGSPKSSRDLGSESSVNHDGTRV